MSLKIKVCGMREATNIAEVAALPIDYMGFIFYDKSPRYVTDFKATQTDVTKVGVFVNADFDFILSRIVDFDLKMLQLHTETPHEIQRLKQYLSHKGHTNIPIIKVFSVGENFDFTQLIDYEEVADYFLFDTQTPKHGGSGIKFDWNILKQYDLEKPFFLAGGISAADAPAILNLNLKNLYAIDLNSKFEIRPALKDITLLSTFISQIITHRSHRGHRTHSK
jgi:phosphoribosylanthranilate isomerase